MLWDEANHGKCTPSKQFSMDGVCEFVRPITRLFTWRRMVRVNCVDILKTCCGMRLIMESAQHWKQFSMDKVCEFVSLLERNLTRCVPRELL